MCRTEPVGNVRGKSARRPRSSRLENGVIESAAGKPKTGRNIFRFEVREFFEHLLLSQPCGEQVTHINYSNPHPTDARPPSALRRIDGNPFDELRHDTTLLSKSIVSTLDRVTLKPRGSVTSLLNPRRLSTPLFYILRP
jgi:hypothetical protein